MKFVTVVGARPQFIKASAVSRELRAAHTEILVHTGQHYDDEMSAVFFAELGISAPDYALGVGSGSHGAQTGAMLAAVERVLESERPDVVIVYGDTNSTLAGALAAAKLKIPIAHVEAGLRSFDRNMPEEVNRIVADHLSRWLFTPSEASRAQLEREGIVNDVYVVGDVMLDALQMHRDRAAAATILERLCLSPQGYYVATIHRAENADDMGKLSSIFEGLARLDQPVVVPLHPRTRKSLDGSTVRIEEPVRVISPLGYLDMLALQSSAACILTDSGGVQKEAYWLHVPCVTLRNETEWIETVDTGWNTLAGADALSIVASVTRSRRPPDRHPDLYGDGTAARRMVNILTHTAAR